MKTIGIIGSRRRDDIDTYLSIKDVLVSIYELGDSIVSGGCLKGGDRFAEMLAYEFRIPIIIYKPDWTLGRHAGFLRNTDIAKDADILIASVASDRKGGTEDTIRKFKKFHPNRSVIIC